MNILLIYIIVSIATLILCGVLSLYEDDKLKEAMIISILNVFYLSALLSYRILKLLVKRKGNRLLGYKPRTFADYSKLGMKKDEYPSQLKVLLRILLKTKEEIK